jgi:3-oxoacyl-[acyl-carrier-protein] synthase-3
MGAVIKGITSCLPSKKLSNEMLAEEFKDWAIEKIYEKTGIAERSIAGVDECASDLGIIAAQKLFASGLCVREDIDFLLFCTQTPDYFLPSTACIIQEKLGLKNNCGALDYNLGCSGFVYGLAMAKGLIETGAAQNILLITAETYTKLIHPGDRSVRTIFSDGAAATLIGTEHHINDAIGPFLFGTDGKGAKNLIVMAGGFRAPISTDTGIVRDEGGNIRSGQHLFMDGPEIFNFSLKVVPSLVRQLLEKENLDMEEIDYFVFHQANKFMLESLRRKIKIPKEKFCINLEYYGNTVSSTIPMAIEIARLKNEIANGKRVMIVGFGVGYSWAAGLIKFV